METVSCNLSCYPSGSKAALLQSSVTVKTTTKSFSACVATANLLFRQFNNNVLGSLYFIFRLCSKILRFKNNSYLSLGITLVMITAVFSTNTVQLKHFGLYVMQTNLLSFVHWLPSTSHSYFVRKFNII